MSNVVDALPNQTPGHIKHLMTVFTESLEADAPASAFKHLQQLFAFLLGHFTDLATSMCVSLGASSELYCKSEDDIISLVEAETRLLEALNFLSERQGQNPGAGHILEVFVDLRQGASRTYLEIIQGKATGSLSGLKRFSDFCRPPSKSPSRAEASKVLGQYAPLLEAWLNCGAEFWQKCTVLEESTSLKGRQKIRYRLENTVIEAGARTDVQDCAACMPCRVINFTTTFMDPPETLSFPGGIPEHMTHLADRWADRVEDGDTIGCTSLMRDTFEFLVRYFAGVSSTLCQALERFPDAAWSCTRNTESIDNCERLLQLCINALKSQQDDPAARALVNVFYRRTSTLELEPRSHTNLLLIEGVLSSWFKRERGQQPNEERSLKDFERYYPILRDWIRALFQFFNQCEQLEEPPTSEGHLPLSVRLGDYLLELVAPAYTLRIRQCPVCLPNPVWMKEGGTASVSPKEQMKLEKQRDQAKEAEAKEEEEKRNTPKVFPGEFPPVNSAPDSPKFLLRQTNRLDVYVRRGEFPEARSALQDVLDYLVRYWAGVAVAACRVNGTISPAEDALARNSLSIQPCERLLNECLKDLVADNSQLAQEILSIFYEVDIVTDELKAKGSHARILSTDADSQNKMQLLADFCESGSEKDTGRCRSDLKTFLPVVRDWLKSSQSFFEQCEHHEEDIDSQGRLELVVQFDQTFLELVAPDYAFYVKVGSDVVPDLPVPNYIAPVVEAAPVQETKKVVAQTAESLALAEPFLVHRVAFVGIRKNSKDVSCKSGKIRIENAGGGSLTGRAYSTHPCIEVSPSRFRDNTNLDYWLDEKSIPKDFIPTIVLRSGGDERTVTVSELRPISALTTLSKTQAITYIYSIVFFSWLLYFGAYFWDTAAIAKYMTENSVTLSQIASDEAARNAIISRAQLTGWVHLAVPVISGSCVFWLFRRLSPVMQDLIVKHFERALMLPPLLELVFWLTFRTGYTTHPDLKPLNIGSLLPWFFVFSLGTYIYVQASYRNIIAAQITVPAFRRLVGPTCLLVFVMMSVLALL